jgi:Ca2+-transporting ATPase
MAFATLIVANLTLILTNASWSRSIVATLRSRNQALFWVLSGALVFLALVLYVPPLSRVFSFAGLSAPEVVACVGVGTASVVWFELAKMVLARRGRTLLAVRRSAS